MTGDNLRVGVVGAGGIGRTHLRAYAAAGNPAIGVTDVDSDRATAVAEEFGVTAYPDLDAMLAAGVDAVSVCTPPAEHGIPSTRALRAGVAVLCEKPLAPTLPESEKLAAAAHEAGVLLSVGFCHRFQPEVRAMRQAARRGDIGTVLTFRNRFSAHLAGVEDSWFSRRDVAGGGTLMDTSVHSVDLFRYLVGDIAQVRALTATTTTELGPALDVEDTALLTLASTGGVLGSIEASWRTVPPEATITLYGTRGTLHLDYASMTLSRCPGDGSTPEVVEVDTGDRFAHQAVHFVACVRGEAEPEVTAADGVAAIAALADAYRSAR